MTLRAMSWAQSMHKYRIVVGLWCSYETVHLDTPMVYINPSRVLSLYQV